MRELLVRVRATKTSDFLHFNVVRASFGACLRPHAVFRRTAAADVINCLRAIHRFDSANSVSRWAVFFCSPRKRTFTKPNWRLSTRNGCSTLARMLALACSFFCSRAFALPR